MFPTSQTRIQTVGLTVEGGERHVSLFLVNKTMRQSSIPTGSHYFLSGAPVAGRSEFQMSVPHFHLPSACFSQTSTYLPWSLIGLPLGSFIVSSYVPLRHARSPDFATSTLVVLQLMVRPGLASSSFQPFRIASFVVSAEAFGGITMASSE